MKTAQCLGSSMMTTSVGLGLVRFQATCDWPSLQLATFTTIGGLDVLPG